MVEVGSTVGGHRLVRLLGHGGFGSVYLGEDSWGGLGAVKIMHPQHAGDQGIRDRFAREVELARKVASFCTARVIDADPFTDAPWVVTEYVEGRTLHDTVRLDGPRTGADLDRLAVSTATALAAIHAAEIVHRDFTPANIMLAPDGPRVIDFGVARALEGSATLSSSLIGTPKYMAPEQISGEPATSAIDLFAWGSVITFAATGRAPFDGPHPAAILHRLVSEEPDISGLPEPLLPVVTRCLDKDPAQRPTATELLTLLIDTTMVPTPAPVQENPAEHGEPGERAEPAEHAEAAEREEEEPAEDPLEEPDEPQEELAEEAAVEPAEAPAPVEPAAAVEPPPPPAQPLPVRTEWRFPYPKPGEGFEVGDSVFHHPGDLAASMSRHWEGAVAMLASPSGRKALVNWLPPGSPARREIENNRNPDHDLEAARLVALLRPDLAPSYRGVRMTLTEISRMAARRWEHHDPVVSSAVQGGLLQALAPHHCAEPEHLCMAGRPCSVYEEVARRLPIAARLAEGYALWSASLDGRFTDPRMRVDVRPLTLAARLATELVSDRDADESLERAAARVPPGPWREALRESALPVPFEDRRAAAVALDSVTGVAQSADHVQKRLAGLRSMEASRAALVKEAAFTSVVAFLGAFLFTLLCAGFAISLSEVVNGLPASVLLSVTAFAWAGFYTWQKRRELPQIPPLGEVDAVRKLLVDGDREVAARVLDRSLELLPRAALRGATPRRR
ncbi:serine/threonine-protein kinase [Nocardiopsis valliformis]|uniref:serine/threonine-protein kinase n=1 Tax=Nocardiopsis valliformis TaxID=239974 RepID=UPI00034553EE|nr:serine/threonine-protein kinase [Nocardiopsis valliformis]